MLDGYKMRSLPRQWSRQPSHEALLVRSPKSVKIIESTMRLHREGTLSKDISIDFIYLLSYCLFHFGFSFYNQFLLCVSCRLLACVFDSVHFFMINDTLLQFNLSILILDKLCMNLLCLYRYFL